jgi:hypothetical protein
MRSKSTVSSDDNEEEEEGKHDKDDAAVEHLMMMGYGEFEARDALRDTGGGVDKAVRLLLAREEATATARSRPVEPATEVDNSCQVEPATEMDRGFEVYRQGGQDSEPELETAMRLSLELHEQTVRAHKKEQAASKRKTGATKKKEKHVAAKTSKRAREDEEKPVAAKTSKRARDGKETATNPPAAFLQAGAVVAIQGHRAEGAVNDELDDLWVGTVTEAKTTSRGKATIKYLQPVTPAEPAGSYEINTEEEECKISMTSIFKQFTGLTMNGATVTGTIGEAEWGEAVHGLLDEREKDRLAEKEEQGDC